MSQQNLPISAPMTFTPVQQISSQPPTMITQAFTSPTTGIDYNDTVVIEAASIPPPFPMPTGNNNSTTNIGSVTTATTGTAGISTTVTVLSTTNLQTAPPVVFNTVPTVQNPTFASIPTATSPQRVSTGIPSPQIPTINPAWSKLNTSKWASPLASIFNNSFTGPIFGFEIPNINIYFDTRNDLNNPTVLINITDRFPTDVTVIKKYRDVEDLTKRSVTANIDLSNPNRGNNFGITTPGSLPQILIARIAGESNI